MSNWAARDFTIPLHFLDNGNYKATVCTDGVNAERYASDYNLRDETLTKDKTLPVHLAPGGGFLIRLIKE